MRLGFMLPHDRERMAFARAHGCDSAELQVKPGNGYFPGDPDWERRADEVAVDFAEHALTISCIAGFYVNHFDPRLENEAKRLVRGSVLLANRMGVPVTAGFAGRYVDRPLEESLPRFRDLWSEHARFAADHGVKIAFENCPMGPFHLPAGGINLMCTPAMWERCFDAVPGETIGLEWDPSHLVCLFVDPIPTIRRFARRIHHVHAKDAHVNRDLLAQLGIYHAGVAEHCFAGLGDTNWPLAIKELLRQGYAGDMNIEGWHDLVYRDFKDGPRREDQGLALSLRYLSAAMGRPA